MNGEFPDIGIDSARLDDAPAVAALALELGYPGDGIAARLARVLDDPEQAVLAARAGNRLLGWAHVRVSRQLLREPYADLTGLVVSEGARGQGIGAALLEEVENWARQRALASVRLRSNVTRKRAHAFYLREGYQEQKESKAFLKNL